MKSKYQSSKSGFTLAEILIAVTLSAFVLTSAYAAIISLAKGTESLVNYTEMNNQSRKALELFGRDARAASEVYDWATAKCTLKREIWNGSGYDDRFTTYEFLPSAGTFTRSVYTITSSDDPGTLLSNEILLYDVEQLSFTYYRLHDPESTSYDPTAQSLAEVKHVQLEALLIRNVLSAENTNYIISARFMMRNRHVAE